MLGTESFPKLGLDIDVVRLEEREPEEEDTVEAAGEKGWELEWACLRVTEDKAPVLPAGSTSSNNTSGLHSV